MYCLESYIKNNLDILYVEPTKANRSIDYRKTIDYWFSFGPVISIQSDRPYFRGDNIDIFNELVKTTQRDNWSCEIQNIFGLLESKSFLDKYKTLDDFAEQGTYNLINDISLSQLDKILRHFGLQDSEKYRITTGSFLCCLWDERVFFSRHDGSHHFAAARFIASRIAKEVMLYGSVSFKYINTIAATYIINKYHIFLMKIEYKTWNNMHSLLDAAKIPYYFCEYRSASCYAVILPVDDKKTMVLSKILSNLGFFFLNSSLKEILANQSTIMGKLGIQHDILQNQ